MFSSKPMLSCEIYFRGGGGVSFFSMSRILSRRFTNHRSVFGVSPFCLWIDFEVFSLSISII